jgi:hypothetical protein
MPAVTWKCSRCGTVNTRHSGACMACGATQAAAAAMPSAQSDTPTLKIEVAPTPSKVSKASASASSPEASKARGTLFDSTASRPVTGRVETGFSTESSPRLPWTADPAASVATGTAAGPPMTPISPGVPTTPAPRASAASGSPGDHVRLPTSRSGGSARGVRSFAVGKLLGIGHIALFVLAIQLFLAHRLWGTNLLAWAHHVSVDSGARVTRATKASWEANGVVRNCSRLVSHLPWGSTVITYVALAIACLVTRLARAMPGWLSLVVALPAAIYGVLASIAEFPWLAAYWPLTGITLFAAWIFVGKTLQRY